MDLGRIKTAHYYVNKSKESKADDYTNLNNLSLCKLKLKDLKNGFFKGNAFSKNFSNAIYSFFIYILKIFFYFFSFKWNTATNLKAKK